MKEELVGKDGSWVKLEQLNENSFVSPHAL